MTASSDIVLRPDEVLCQWCDDLFISPEAYEAHKPSRRACWGGPRVAAIDCGLVCNDKGQFEFAHAKDPTRRLRRTNEMAAFDRVLAELEYRGQFLSSNARSRIHDGDIDKVKRALERERDGRH